MTDTLIQKGNLSTETGLPWWLGSKEVTCNAGDAAGAKSSVPGLGTSPEEGNVNPLQYSFLGNPMDRGDTETCIEEDNMKKQCEYLLKPRSA